MKKYIVHVGVGDLPQKEAFSYVKKVRKKMKKNDFFPKDRTIYLPFRGHPTYVETIEID